MTSAPNPVRWLLEVTAAAASASPASFEQQRQLLRCVAQFDAPSRTCRCGPGRPRTRPERVVADKGYSSTKIRSYLRRRGIKAAFPERIDQFNGRIRRGEGLCRLDRTAYRRRNVVERCFNELKHNKALATRYDKRARHYKALVTLACLRLWLP